MAMALTSSISDLTIPINKILILFIPILSIADLCAVYTYSNYIKFNHIKLLFLPILIGMIYGTYFLQTYSDIIIRKYVGYSFIFLSIIHYLIPFLQQSILSSSTSTSRSIILPYYRTSGERLSNESHNNNNNSDDDDNYQSRKYSFQLFYNQIKHVIYGLLIGYFTMISNVGGPIVVVYLIQLKIHPNELNGARSILFLIINILKITLQIYLKNLNFTDLNTIELIGGLSILSILFTLITYYWIMPRIGPSIFENITWILVILSGVKLICGV